MSDPIAALIDKAAITETLYRYARGWDRRDAALIRATFHDDAVIDVTGEPLRAHDMIADWLAGLAEVVSMSHSISNILIELDGDRAVSECHQVSHHRRAGDVDWFLKGRYLDRWERRDGAWRIARRMHIADFDATIAGADARSQIGDMHRGACGPADPSYALFASLRG